MDFAELGIKEWKEKRLGIYIEKTCETINVDPKVTSLTITFQNRTLLHAVSFSVKWVKSLPHHLGGEGYFFLAVHKLILDFLMSNALEVSSVPLNFRGFWSYQF